MNFLKLARNIRVNISRSYKRPALHELEYKIEQNNIDPRYASALEKFEESGRIIYNSVLSVQKVRLREYDLITSRIEYKRKKAEESKIEPLPVVLSQLCEDPVVNDLEQPDVQFKKRNFGAKKIDFPFSRFLKVESVEPDNSEPEEKVPKNWLKDYELYDDSEDEFSSHYGTPNPSFPVTDVPCGGCGAHLHCKDPSIPGYLPSEIVMNIKRDELTTVICQRCHFLKRYKTAISVTVRPDDYINIISSIKDEKALAIVMVDLLDFPCSIFPNLADLLGKMRPVFLVGNKVDLIPKDHPSYLDHITECLRQEAVRLGFEEKSIKHVGLISAQTGYGVEELISKLHSIWRYRGNVYLIGCTNVGKSTLFNALLRSDFCKVDAVNIVQRATASPWPGTTLRMLKFPILRPSDKIVYLRTQRLISERNLKQKTELYRREKAAATGKIKYATLMGHIGMTFEKKEDEIDIVGQNQQSGFKSQILKIHENSEKYRLSKWCYDTPGVMHTDQVLQMLTTDEILKVLPRQMITPRVFYISSGMSVFIAGLARLDCIDIPIPTRIIIYSSLDLPISICKIKDAEEFYDSFLGSELLGVPIKSSEDRLEKWPKLEARYDDITVEGEDKYVSICDFVMSSVGWIGINIPANCRATFRPWTIEKRGFFVRKPALLPNGWELRGQRIRDTPAYRLGSAFTSRKNPKRKNYFSSKIEENLEE